MLWQLDWNGFGSGLVSIFDISDFVLSLICYQEFSLKQQTKTISSYVCVSSSWLLI
jgi:hypothetical protein